MDFLLDYLNERAVVLRKPSGLDELLHQICHEVLRCHPVCECLYKFIADYLESLQRTRDNAAEIEQIMNGLVCKINEITTFMQQCQLECEKTMQMAAQIEKLFRKFLYKNRCCRDGSTDYSLPEFVVEDLLGALMDECKFTWRQLARSRQVIKTGYRQMAIAYNDAIKGTQNTEALYHYYEEKDRMRKFCEKRNRAALTIQTNWRGFYVRKYFCCKLQKMCQEERRREALAKTQCKGKAVAKSLQDYHTSMEEDVKIPVRQIKSSQF